MARLKTAQPSSSLRKIAVVVATAVSGMSVYAQAAVDPKEETITVTLAACLFMHRRQLNRKKKPLP